MLPPLETHSRMMSILLVRIAMAKAKKQQQSLEQREHCFGQHKGSGRPSGSENSRLDGCLAYIVCCNTSRLLARVNCELYIILYYITTGNSNKHAEIESKHTAHRHLHFRFQRLSQTVEDHTRATICALIF